MHLPDRGERAVCRRCHIVMPDLEPMGNAEFYHPKEHKDGTRSKCPNAGKTFFWTKHTTVGGKISIHQVIPAGTPHPEIEPFMRKRTRRAAKRVKR